MELQIPNSGNSATAKPDNPDGSTLSKDGVSSGQIRDGSDGVSERLLKSAKSRVSASIAELAASRAPWIQASTASAGETSPSDEASKEELNLLIAESRALLQAAKELAARRSADLAAITHHLRSLEAKAEAQNAEIVELRKTLSSSDGIVSNLILQAEAARERSDFLQYEAVRAKDLNRGNVYISKSDQSLLRDFARVTLSDGDIYHLVRKSKLFDSKWYALQTGEEFAGEEEALSHYLSGRNAYQINPSPDFDGLRYIKEYDDVASAELNPLLHYVQFGVCEGRPIFPVKASPVVRIIMMCKNEIDLIYPWVLFHGLRFGFENIFIFDNGSDQPMRSRLAHIESWGVRVDYSHSVSADFAAKGEIIASLIQEMDDEDPADFYFPLDCDEFIGVELGEGQYSFAVEDLRHELNSFVGSADALVISAYLDNHPRMSGSFKRVGGQRKSFFPRGACQGLDRGYNNPKTRSGGRRKTAIIYVHYHYKPFALLQQHSRQKLENFIDDFSRPALHQYIEEKKTGFHSARHLLVDEKEYISRIDAKLFEYCSPFANAFEDLGLDLPFSERRA